MLSGHPLLSESVSLIIVLEFMEKSTLKHRLLVGEIESTPIYKSKIEVDDYVDLGTRIKSIKFLNAKENNSRL